MFRCLVLPLGFLLSLLAYPSTADESARPATHRGDMVTVYMGVSLGLDTYSGHIDAKDDGSIAVADDDGQSWVRGLRIGVHRQNVGLELQYVNLGQSKFTGTSSGGPFWSAGSIEAAIHATGWRWLGVARYPINDQWVVSGRVGGFSWEATETLTQTSGSSTVEDHGTTATFGFCLERDFQRLPIALHVDWDHFVIGADELSMNGFTAGLDYRF